MDDRERSEEARLSAIRQRARSIEQSERPTEKRENVEPGVAERPGPRPAGRTEPPGESAAGPSRPRRGPMVSTWRSARSGGPRMPGAYPGMMGGYPGYWASPTPVGMPFEPGHPGWSGPMRGRDVGWDAEREGWTPRAHVLERGGQLVARVELPGLDRKDVEVHVENDCLIVEGERPDDRPAEERTQRGERRYGPFRREFPLPYPADPSAVKATFRNGLLEVVVPQPSREERRKPIQVET